MTAPETSEVTEGVSKMVLERAAEEHKLITKDENLLVAIGEYGLALLVERDKESAENMRVALRSRNIAAINEECINLFGEKDDNKKVIEDVKKHKQLYATRETKECTPSELKTVMKSKRDLYNFVTCTHGLYMPKYEACNTDFMWEVLNGEKNALTLGELKPVNVPGFKELKVEIFEKMREEPLIASYFPNTSLKKLRDKEFVMNILNTLKSAEFSSYLEYSLATRNADSNAIHPGKSKMLAKYHDKLATMVTHPTGSDKHSIVHKVAENKRTTRRKRRKKPEEIKYPKAITERTDFTLKNKRVNQ